MNECKKKLVQKYDFVFSHFKSFIPTHAEYSMGAVMNCDRFTYFFGGVGLLDINGKIAEGLTYLT